MQDKLVDLLEALEKAPNNKLTWGELVDQKGIDGVFIKEANEMSLIWNADNKNVPLRILENKDTQIRLTIQGFAYLNQIRIKNAIEKFNESSDKSSEIMIALTFAIYTFTIFLVALTMYEKNVSISKILIVLVIIAVMIVGYYKIFLKKDS